MSTDAEKVGAMVSAMHSALEKNKELHREITALKAENLKLTEMGFKQMVEYEEKLALAVDSLDKARAAIAKFKGE